MEAIHPSVSIYVVDVTHKLTHMIRGTSLCTGHTWCSHISAIHVHMCFWTSPVPQLPERMCLCCPLWWGLPHHRASPTAPLPPLLCHIPSALMQIRLPTTIAIHPSLRRTGNDSGMCGRPRHSGEGCQPQLPAPLIWVTAPGSPPVGARECVGYRSGVHTCAGQRGSRHI